MTYYFDRDGEPIDLDTWARRYDDDTQRIVEQTEIGDTFVSTVWTGLDLGHRPSKRPLIFETMVYRRGRVDEEIRCRYVTETDARIGHMEICLELRGELLDLDGER